jgi:aerobic carbon-monoxide dehydrogenase medium subunit
MKPPAFRYRKPDELDEALALLAEPNAVALAGGQDLLPLLNSRRIRPSTVVDLGGLSALRGITEGADGVRIGALARHRDVLDSTVIRRRLGLLHLAAGHIGHGAIRNRGTLGGSCASALRGAELPTALVALGASMHLVSTEGRRSLPAAEFFDGGKKTALWAGELVEAVTVPVPPEGASWSFAEHTHRGAFKFPLISVAALRAPQGTARIVVGGGAAGPVEAAPEDTGGLADLADRLVLTDQPQAGRLYQARIARSLIGHCIEHCVEGSVERSNEHGSWCTEATDAS